MKNLQLIPAVHKDLIALVKRQKGARWSQTLRSWYFQKKDFEWNAFYRDLKGKVFIDYSKLKKSISPIAIQNATPNKLLSSIALPKEYKEQLILKRYSPNTIKTYCSCFLKFIAFSMNSGLMVFRKKIFFGIQAFCLCEEVKGKRSNHSFV